MGNIPLHWVFPATHRTGGRPAVSGATGGDFARKLVDKLQEVAKDRGSQVAQQWGTPLDGEAPTREQALELWNLRRPESLTPEGSMLVQQLLAQGMVKQAVNFAYPWRLARVEPDPATGEPKQFRGLIPRGDINKQIKIAQQFADQASMQGMEADGGAGTY